MLCMPFQFRHTSSTVTLTYFRNGHVSLYVYQLRKIYGSKRPGYICLSIVNSSAALSLINSNPEYIPTRMLHTAQCCYRLSRRRLHCHPTTPAPYSHMHGAPCSTYVCMCCVSYSTTDLSPHLIIPLPCLMQSKHSPPLLVSVVSWCLPTLHPGVGLLQLCFILTHRLL